MSRGPEVGGRSSEGAGEDRGSGPPRRRARSERREKRQQIGQTTADRGGREGRVGPAAPLPTSGCGTWWQGGRQAGEEAGFRGRGMSGCRFVHQCPGAGRKIPE